MEVLHRRGYVDVNTRLPTDDEARKIAMATPGFKNEPSEIESVIEALGVGVVFTPKGHCEIARRGIEHLRGASKVFLDRQIQS